MREAVGHVEQDQHAGGDQRDNALEQELPTDGGIDVADLVLDEVVVGVLLIQGSQQVVELLGGQCVTAGQGDSQGLVAGNIRAGLQGQIDLAQLGADGGLQVVQVSVALIGQCVIMEPPLNSTSILTPNTAQNTSTTAISAQGEGVELLAVADEVDGRGS